jgi:CheY-like chemotaxis protein/anti-sigma regulatory factor (Ser/Thr protein kinase)
MANEAQIYQIILNLCSNAFNAMESEGGVIEISVKEVDDRLVLTFKDSGIGIESGNRKWIFDPFFNGKTIGKGKGTGLGLSVIYRLIEAHNGTINIDSKHDIGTTVTITIPTVMEGAANSDEAHSANKGPGRILIADDEIGLLALYKEILESENYEVTIKENGADALATFRENPDFFDLVITDQTMPKMTGKELAMNLLQIRPELPIIMTSGYDQSLRSEQVNTDSIRCYLQKPIGLRQLVDAVQIQLEAGQLG